MSYVSIDSEGRIQSVTEIKEYASQNAFEFTFPENFDFTNQYNYKIVDNELVYDELPLSEEQTLANEKIRLQSQLEVATIMFVNEYAPNLTDQQALDLDLIFYDWKSNVNYKKDCIIRYNGELYRIGQDHTSQDQWKPGDNGTIALYSHITITEDGYEVWKAWDGVSGLYSEGQIVENPEDGKLYKSKIPNNVWGPPHTFLDYWELYDE